MQTEGRAPIRSSGANRARRLFVIFTVSIFALDLITKNWATSYLQYREPVKVIGDFLQLTFATNPGAAFNLIGDATLILSSLKARSIKFPKTPPSNRPRAIAQDPFV
ncbi:MAG: signal peptidase II, partial [Actinomycetota bacterium]